MKIKQIFEELREIAKQTGITIRHEPGRFKSGFCILNDQKLIIFNRSTPVETKSVVLASILNEQGVEGIYLKPVIREFIEKENKILTQEDNYTFDLTDIGEEEEESEE